MKKKNDFSLKKAIGTYVILTVHFDCNIKYIIYLPIYQHMQYDR